jgi:hypothetical protein
MHACSNSDTQQPKIDFLMLECNANSYVIIMQSSLQELDLMDIYFVIIKVDLTSAMRC